MVVDVPSLGRATLRVGGGKETLSDVRESCLETALPKPPGEVVVVRGKYRGQGGTLMERNSSKNRAVVQLHEDQSVVALSLDEVAQAAEEEM